MFEKLVEHKIISNNEQFFCLLCMCAISSFEDALLHIYKREHQILKNNETNEMLENYISEMFHESDGNNEIPIIVLYNFICLPCKRSFRDLKCTLHHIESEAHAVNLKMQNENFDCSTVKSIISNISAEGKMNLKNLVDTSELTLLATSLQMAENDKAYVNNKYNKPFKIIIALYNFKENVCERLINNKIIANECCHLICETCNHCYKTINGILSHQTSSKIHIRTLKHIDTELQMSIEKESKEQSSNEHIADCGNTKMINEEKNLNLIETQDIHQSIAAISETVEIKNSQEIVKTGKCKICFSRSCNKDCLKMQEQSLIDSGIIINASNTFYCTICKRILMSLHDTLLHLKGKSHKSIIKAQKICLSILKDNTNANEEVDVNSSSSVMNVDFNQKDGSNNSVLEIKDIFEYENSEVPDKDKNDVTFLYSSYFCELCKVQININNLAEHVNSVPHKCNIFSMAMGDDIILFKCFCCKSLIQGNSMLINHLVSTNHESNLSNHLTSFEKNGNTTYAPTCYTILKNLKSQSLLLCNILIPDEKSAYMYFNEECLILLDMPDIKDYNNTTNNILYYCSLCRVKLNTVHNLISHCGAKVHLWKIKQLFSKKHQDNTYKIATMTDHVNRLSDFDDDFVLMNDINVDITKDLNASPFLGSRKKGKIKKQNLAKRLNKFYSKKHLEIEDEMYTIHEQKLNNIKANLKLIIPFNKQNFYCLVCNKQVSRELYLLYEHMCLHLHKINEIECINKNPSFVELSEHYIKKISKEFVKCLSCENKVHNDANSINIHTNSRTHKKKLKLFVEVMDNVFNAMLHDLNNLWYYIQRFCCVLCDASFNYKLEFIEHIIATHIQHLNVYVYDFCIPCTTLWLYDDTHNKTVYAEHCSDITHQYLIKSKDFMVEELPNCIKTILAQVDELSDTLFEKTEVLLNDNIQQEVKQSLENILKSYFPSIEVFLFGSRVTGLGFASSDIDVYLNCNDTYYETEDENVRKQHLKSIKAALHEHKTTWDLKEMLEETRTPIIKLIYKRTGVYCDISVTNGLSVENSKLIRLYNDAYVPCRKLILFIKKWLSYCNFPAKHGMTSYALAWLVIFYLQTESYLPSVATLIKEKNSSRRVCGWEVGVAVPKNSDKSVQSVSTLLLGFFEFYANFDYRHYVICPLLGKPLSKLTFTKIRTLPDEMKPYIERLTSTKDPEYFRIDSPLCVQDPFDLSHNLTKAVSSITLRSFMQYCADSASILHSL